MQRRFCRICVAIVVSLCLISFSHYLPAREKDIKPFSKTLFPTPDEHFLRNEALLPKKTADEKKCTR